MSKTNCLIGINIFNLEHKGFMLTLMKELEVYPFDARNSLHISYGRLYYQINYLYLIDIEKNIQLYIDNMYEEDWDNVLKNPDKYLLFDISWSDSTLQSEIDEAGIDFLKNKKTILSIKKHFNEYRHKKCSGIDIKDVLFDLLYTKDVSKYFVLNFEQLAFKDYYGEWDVSINYKGILDINNLNLLDEE